MSHDCNQERQITFSSQQELLHHLLLQLGAEVDHLKPYDKVVEEWYTKLLEHVWWLEQRERRCALHKLLTKLNIWVGLDLVTNGTEEELIQVIVDTFNKEREAFNEQREALLEQGFREAQAAALQEIRKIITEMETQ